MASFHTQAVRCLSVSARLMRTPNIQRPLVPGTERRLLDAVTVPILPPDARPPTVKCLEEAQRKLESRQSELSEAYLEFQVNQAKKMFHAHKMVAIVHSLPLAPRDLLALRTKLRAVGLKLVIMKNDIAIKATENTKFQNLAPFFVSTTKYVISPEVKVHQLAQVLKKVSELHLLGGVVEDKILSRDAMMDMAKLPPLDVLRGELLTILKAPASRTRRLLGSQQQELSRCLGQLAVSDTPPGVEADV